MGVVDGFLLSVTGVACCLLGAGLFATAVRSARRLRLAASGRPDSIADGHRDGEGLYVARAAEMGVLALAVDRFGYWWQRNGVQAGPGNAYGLLASVLFLREYDRDDLRSDSDRRRASVLSPSPLEVDATAGRFALALDDDASVVQRLVPNHGLVPWLVFLAVVVLLVSPVLLNFFFLPVLYAAVAFVARTPSASAALAVALSLFVVVWYRNGHAPLDAWNDVVPATAPAVPERVRDAATDADPDGTGLVYLRDLDRGDAIYVLGTVDRRSGERPGRSVLAIDGVVSTRGPRYLALVAATRLLKRVLYGVAVALPGLALLVLGARALVA